MSAACYVVTGASSGIGAAVAARLLARGEGVVAVARHADALERLYGQNPNALCVAADLELPDATARVSAALRERFGSVRGFVHCAGFAAPAPLGLVQDATAHRLFAVHALFPMQFLGWMAKRQNHVDGAAAVLVSSIACHEGDAGNVAYASAKGAVEGMLKAAAAELAQRGVRVNAIAPGLVDTEMARNGQVKDFSRATTPVQIAEVIEFFLDERSSCVNGQCLVADGGPMPLVREGRLTH